MSKIAIYTCIVGNYDSLMLPLVTNDAIDYICFVKKGTRISNETGIWKIKEIPYDCDDKRILSRFVKLNPHIALPDYDYSVYLDGNVSIAHQDFYEIIFNKIRNGTIYSGVCHWGRDCAYDEALAVLNSKKDSLMPIVKSIRFLKKQHFPRHFGMYENNVIFRKHSDSKIVTFNEMWWEYYTHFSKRDQIFHSYCLWRNQIGFDLLFPKEYSARNHYSLLYKKHDIIEKKLTLGNAIIRKSTVLLARLLTLL